jgi:hypothetical protein
LLNGSGTDSAQLAAPKSCTDLKHEVELLRAKVENQTKTLKKVLRIINDVDYENRIEISGDWPCNGPDGANEIDSFLTELDGMKKEINEAIR